MLTALTRNVEFPEGYRITRAGGSLFIETTADHPAPLRLRRDQLAEFGLRLEAGRNFLAHLDPRGRSLLSLSRALFGLAVLLAAMTLVLLVPSVLSGR